MAVGLYSGVSGLALGIGLYRNVSGLWGGASGLIDGFGGADPYAGASLYLNFLDPTLDSRITFSRGTNATLIDSTGRLTYAPNNPVLWSEDFTNGVWNPAPQGSASAAVVTADAGVAPNGTLTADRIQFARTGTTSVDRSRVVQSNVPLSTSTDYVFSIWLKSFSGSNQTVTLFPNFGLGSSIAVTVTSEWQRFAVTANSSTSALGQFVIGLGYVTNAVTSADVLVWGAQLEAVTYQTTPGTYVATTTAAYYGPRFDYDPVTLAPRGLLIEEQRTNLLTYSEQFDNAAWVKSNATVSANSTIAPDGVLTADTLVSSVTNTAKHISQSGIASTVGTFTVYAKAAGETTLSLWLVGATVGAIFTLTGSGSTTLNGATSSSIQQLANGWYRCSVYSSSATTTAHIYLRNGSGYVGDGTSGVYIYGAQLEAGSFATSYIPTVASTVIRNADVATMTGTNFSSWYNQSEGTIVMDAIGTPSVVANIWFPNAVGGPAITDNDGSNNVRVSLRAVAYVDTGGVPTTTGLQYRTAFAYKQADYASSTSGSAVQVSANATAPAAVTTLTLGSTGSVNFINAHLRTIAYFNTRLPNAQLQTLTAPSLATTLHLDFTSGSYLVGF